MRVVEPRPHRLDAETRALLERVYRQSVPALRRYLTFRGVAPQDVSDVITRVFLRLGEQALESRDALPSAGVDARGRLPLPVLGLARREAFNHRRSTVRREAHLVGVENVDLPPADGAPSDPTARPQLLALLASLDDEDRDLIVLLKVEGYEYGEVAGVLGLPEGTAKSRASRILQRLRERLDTPHDDERPT